MRAIHGTAARRSGDAITPSLAGVQLKEWLAEAGGASHAALEVREGAHRLFGGLAPSRLWWKTPE